MLAFKENPVPISAVDSVRPKLLFTVCPNGSIESEQIYSDLAALIKSGPVLKEISDFIKGEGKGQMSVELRDFRARMGMGKKIPEIDIYDHPQGTVVHAGFYDEGYGILDQKWFIQGTKITVIHKLSWD